MGFLYKITCEIVACIARVLASFIPIRSMRHKVRNNIKNGLSFFPFLFVAKSDLHKRLLAVIALSKVYQYDNDRGGGKLPDYNEDVFHIQGANITVGGGGIFLLLAV